MDYNRCSCGKKLMGPSVNSFVDGSGITHRIDSCSSPEKVTSMLQTLKITCSHGETFWATGPDAAGLYCQLGCGCMED